MNTNPTQVYLQTMSEGSQRTTLDSLDRVAMIMTDGERCATDMDWSAVTYEMVVEMRAALVRQYAPATTNKILSAYRGVMKTALRMQQIDADAYFRVSAVRNVRTVRSTRGRMLSSNEVKLLFAAMRQSQSPLRERDQGLLAVMLVTGMRRIEVCRADFEDLDLQTEQLTVRVKGGEVRTFDIHNALPRLRPWLGIRGEHPGALFHPVRNSDIERRRRLSPEGLHYVLRRISRSANVRAFSPHDLRRTYLSKLIELGVDLLTVRDLAGHRSVKTTQLYDRRDSKRITQASRMVVIP